jgi:hypothetical protein
MPSPSVLDGLRNPERPQVSILLNRQAYSAARETANEFTIRLGTIARLFGMPFIIDPSAGQLSGDAGLIPNRQFDERVGLSRVFADAL